VKRARSELCQPDALSGSVLRKGFGFISSDEGDDVFLPAASLPSGVTTVKPGTKLEFGVADGRRGPQALSVTIVEDPTLTRCWRSN